LFQRLLSPEGCLQITQAAGQIKILLSIAKPGVAAASAVTTVQFLVKMQTL